MTVGGVFRGPAAARFRPGLGPAQAEVIHRPENSAGFRARFDGESLGIFGCRCRPALPGSSSSPTVAKYSLLACDVGSICVPGPRTALCHRSAFVSDHQGARHWLIFSFSVRARAPRFQPASRPSGFCSRASPVSLCHCAARLAAKCTSGNPMTLGSAPPGRPAMEISCRHPERRS
jgi:hypothetical protein